MPIFEYYQGQGHCDELQRHQQICHFIANFGNTESQCCFLHTALHPQFNDFLEIGVYAYALYGNEYFDDILSYENHFSTSISMIFIRQPLFPTLKLPTNIRCFLINFDEIGVYSYVFIGKEHNDAIQNCAKQSNTTI